MMNYKTITSVNNSFIKYLTSLKDKKNREKYNEYLIEGYHLVEEARNANVLKQVLVTNPKDFELFSDNSRIELFLVNEDIIKKLTNTINPQEIVGTCCKIECNYRDKLFKRFLLLDDINDPGNLGTIIRSAKAFNIDTIIMSKNTVDVYNEKVIRSTQGMFFKMSFFYEELINTIDYLKENKIPIIATSLNTNCTIDKLPSSNSYAICLGNEAHGISKEVENLADEIIKIPMEENVESLNVGVAGSIVMFLMYMKNK